MFPKGTEADPRIFDILLGILDEGRLTDAQEREISFCSAVIIMTSNLGAEERPISGFEETDRRGNRFQDAIADFFRPEFVNRIDDILPFSALTKDIMQGIVERELGLITERPGFKRSAITCSWTPGLVEHLLTVGFDPELGARPLQQVIDRLVVEPLGERLLDGARPHRTWHLDWQDGLVISVE